jgi:peroxiredoxin
MMTRNTRWLAGALCLLALLVAAGMTARAAEPTTDVEQAAMQELQELITLDPRPESREEQLAKYKELLPKIQAFAKTYKDNQAGERALFVALQIQAQLGKTKEAVATAETFLERYPKSRGVPSVTFFQGAIEYQRRNYEAARKVLTQLVKDHPTWGGKRQATSLLNRMKEIGTEAKDFTTKDLEGNDVRLSDFQGKVVLLDFFAGWCGPCRAEMPNLIKLYETYGDRGFEIIGISLDRTLEKAKAYVESNKLTWTVTYEEPGFWANPVAKLYEVRSIPSTYLLDAKGKVLHVGLRGEALAEVLAALLPSPEEKAEK